MPVVSSFFKYVMMTRDAIGYKFYLLILFNIASASIESVGILLFIPFLTQLGDSTATEPDHVTQTLHMVFAYCDIPVTVGHTLLLLVAAFLLKGFLVFCLAAARPLLIYSTEHRLRQHLMARYTDIDYRYVIRKNTAFFSNLIVTEVPRACVAMNGLCRTASSLITVSILFVTVFFLYRSLSLLVVAAGGLSFVLIAQLATLAKSKSLRISLSNARLHAFLNQALFAFKYLKATAGFGTLQSQISVTSKDISKLQSQLALLDALQFAIQEPLIVIFVASIFYYTVVIVNSYMVPVMVSVILFYRCMVEVGHFHNHWQFAASLIGSLDTVWTSVQEIEHQRETSRPGGPFQFQERIALRDVSYAYLDRPVLHAINMSIPKNAAVAVVGPSGAGKTTLIDIIAGILQPTQGAVYVDQQELSKLDLRRYRQCLGYVGQDTMLFDDTIANNIRMQWDDWIDPLTLDRIREAARASYCDEFIQDLPEGFNTRIGEHGIQLSGGQRQRLAIARELFKNPQVLILDEATSSLDSESETYIQQSIEHLKGALTLVIISHRLSTIRHVDTIYVIQQGHIVEQGTFTVLRHQPGTTFHQMCELQMGPGQNRS